MSNGCYIVPNGWNLVGFVGGNGSASCFANSMTNSVVEGPTGGSCTCGCTMQTQPTCASGPIAVKFDLTNFPNGCGTSGQPSTMNNAGPCATDMYTGGMYPTLDLEYIPPAPSGGACTTSATADPASVTYAAQDTYCTPNAPLCTANMPCMPNLGGQYSVCIEQDGNQSCPAMTFTQKHLVGSGSNFGCGTGCGCTLPSGVACTGKMELFTDNKCMTTTPYDVAASSNGMCVAPMGGEANNYQSYHYVPDPLPPQSCTSTGSSSATNLQLTNPQTICCAP